MNKSVARLLLMPALLTSLTACSTALVSAPSAGVVQTQQAVAAALGQTAQSATLDLGHQNGPSLAVNIAAPAAERTIQAMQHRWVVTDIKTYHVELWTADATTGAKTGTAALASLDISVSSLAAPALAAFTGLPANSKYFVSVDAKGENTSLPETTGIRVLNTQTPANTVFNFLEDANNNIENTPAARTVTIALDSYVFSGNANINATVNAGTFLAPPAGSLIGTAVRPDGLYRISNTEDKVRPGSYVPDGNADLHLQWVHTFSAPTAISSVRAWFPWGGYNTGGVNQFVLGVFPFGGEAFPDPSLAGFSSKMPRTIPAGRQIFDLYLPSAVGGDNDIGTVSVSYTSNGVDSAPVSTQ